MKCFICIILVLLMAFCFSACSSEIDMLDSTNQSSTDYMSVYCTKDDISNFKKIFKEMQKSGEFSNFVFEEKDCYNVTPLEVANETDIKIFKFSDTCDSFILMDGEIFLIGTSFGGYGFFDAVPWDYDEDGNKDVLLTYSWGSGLHRSHLSVFNVVTKELIEIHTEFDTDLFISRQTPSHSVDDTSELPVYYQVYSAEIIVNGVNFADLSYVATDVVGSVSIENGNPIFKSIE